MAPYGGKKKQLHIAGVVITFPFGSTNCIRFKGYFSAQGTPKVLTKVKKLL